MTLKARLPPGRPSACQGQAAYLGGAGLDCSSLQDEAQSKLCVVADARPHPGPLRARQEERTVQTQGGAVQSRSTVNVYGCSPFLTDGDRVS